MIELFFRHAADLWFWLLTGLALLSMGWGFFAVLRQYRFARWLLGVRTMLILIGLVLLLQPEFQVRNDRTIDRKWNIFLDNSLSMGYHQKFSLAAVNSGIAGFQRELEKRKIATAVYHFDQDVRPFYTEPMITTDGNSTDLGAVLTNINKLDPQLNTGAVLITDGQPTQGIDPVQLSENANLPIYTIGIGDTIPMVDVAIHSIDVPTVAIKGETLTLKAVVSAIGNLAERLNVILMYKGQPAGSGFITVRGGDAHQDIQFQFEADELGVNEFELVVSSLEEEINIRNNRQRFKITVLKDHYQVALITGRPNFNTGVIKRLLTDSPRLAVTHFVQKLDRVDPPMKQFWETQFDLIIFDNFPIRPLTTQWQRIFARKLASQKSSIAWFVGPDVNNQLAGGLYPFFHLRDYGKVLDEERDSRLYFAEGFSRSPVMAGADYLRIPSESQLPPLMTGIQVEPAVDELQALAYLEGPVSMAVLIAGEKDNLRSLTWTTPDFSKLYYQLTGTAQASFVSNMQTSLTGWLLRTRGTERTFFRLNKDYYQQGEAIKISGYQIRQENTATTGNPYARISRDDQVVGTVELDRDARENRWQGEFYASNAGDYQYEIIRNNGEEAVIQTGDFTVTVGQIELNKVFVNRRALQRIADNSAGEYFPWDERYNLFDLLQAEETILTRRFNIRFHEEYLLLGIIIALLVSEWIIRRRFGLQ